LTFKRSKYIKIERLTIFKTKNTCEVKTSNIIYMDTLAKFEKCTIENNLTMYVIKWSVSITWVLMRKKPLIALWLVNVTHSMSLKYYPSVVIFTLHLFFLSNTRLSQLFKFLLFKIYVFLKTSFFRAFQKLVYRMILQKLCVVKTNFWNTLKKK